MAAYAAPWAGVVPASPACATQAPGSARAHRTRPADWQARVVQGPAPGVGPGTRASATRIATNEARRSDFSEPGRSGPGRSEPGRSEPGLGGPGFSEPGLSDLDLRKPGRSEPGVTSMSPIGPVKVFPGYRSAVVLKRR